MPLARLTCFAAVAAILFVPSLSDADADGPDRFRVTGLKVGTALVLHRENSPTSDVVGYIPHDARKLKNLGCKGGLTLQQWQNTSPEEREKSKDLRWCRITYKGFDGKAVTGWVNSRYLRED